MHAEMVLDGLPLKPSGVVLCPPVFQIARAKSTNIGPHNLEIHRKHILAV